MGMMTKSGLVGNALTSKTFPYLWYESCFGSASVCLYLMPIADFSDIFIYNPSCALKARNSTYENVAMLLNRYLRSFSAVGSVVSNRAPGTVDGAAADADRDGAAEAARGGHPPRAEGLVRQVAP